MVCLRLKQLKHMLYSNLNESNK